MAREPQNPNAWTPNQIVAYRVAEARRMRGWTQEQAATELEPYLGSKLSNASWSAIERSFAGGRIRQFNADEIVALARAFRLPVGWFYTPPPAHMAVTIRTPDTEPGGLDPMDLIDLVLGDDDTLLEWQRALADWPIPSNIRRLAGDSPPASDKDPIIPDRLNDLLRGRARLRLSQTFGDLDEAKSVLDQLSAVLADLRDETDPLATDNSRWPEENTP